MKLHEFQAKQIFRDYGIPVPEGKVASSPQQALNAAKELNGPPWVVKAQVHAGGRGKGGGVRVVRSLEEVKNAAAQILDKPLVTKQTGPQGKRVYQVLVEQGVEIDRELYMAMVVDRSRARPVMVFSQQGGMEIEEVAARSPELVLQQFVDPGVGWMPFQSRALAYSLDPLPAPETLKEIITIMGNLYKVFISLDCSLAEINPLVITKQGHALAIDAKISIDDNALSRHKDLQALDDPREKDPLDAKAAKYNLNYIRLGGNIGAMVNGAGLAMATMDVIKLAGAEPANFLDVGGGASEEMVRRGFEIILEDENVKAVLINIFGGILRCDVLARGILAAAEKMEINVPLIVRLEGTNVEEGRRILKESNLKFLVANTMAEAAELVTRQVSQ
ncbi:MAG: ADP-forming succinate--CoA ligase subunit beta [Deltaproteobacteria bacterium]|nr:ADP-forming succinate--CoA ligase subunit beta [Deltaproteobacteria bacterium]MBW1935784.1 ADP-forming succinate--CoA ligase subunit beta [Deltaproteobacteria bacterium]